MEPVNNVEVTAGHAIQVPSINASQNATQLLICQTMPVFHVHLSVKHASLLQSAYHVQMASIFEIHNALRSV